jgi:nitroimidazol reductase NimA-like FMN-containing flavoprotein (pyridoxamine 5'-phosphate oxidase superfamily)
MSDQPTKTIASVILRRQDRAVADEEWIQQMLESAPYATMGMNGEDYPHVNMNTFYYDRAERAIYFHTSIEGATRMQVGEGRKVTLTISSMGRLLPARTATQMSVEYRSVMVRGTISTVEDEALAGVKMQAFIEKYFTHLRLGVDYEPISSEELEKIAVYRIGIEAWIGKRKRERDDFPGAFFFGQHKQKSGGA